MRAPLIRIGLPYLADKVLFGFANSGSLNPLFQPPKLEPRSAFKNLTTPQIDR